MWVWSRIAMSLEQTQDFCRTCARHTLHGRETPNNILHFLVAVFTCGAWVIVWMLLHAFSARADWLCQTCGTHTRYKPSGLDQFMKTVVIILFVIALFGVVGMLLSMHPEWVGKPPLASDPTAPLPIPDR